MKSRLVEGKIGAWGRQARRSTLEVASPFPSVRFVRSLESRSRIGWRMRLIGVAGALTFSINHRVNGLINRLGAYVDGDRKQLRHKLYRLG